MSRLMLFAAVAMLALVLQGAFAMVLPPPYCPDLSLLVIIAIGLSWHGLALGLCLAAVLGFAADLLSGSLMGQHALLRVFVFVSAFFAGRQLNLRGSLPLSLFAGVVTLAYGLALFAVSSFFIGSQQLGWQAVRDLLQHAAVNGIIAPWVYSGMAKVSALLGEDEASSRSLHIDARRRSA